MKTERTSAEPCPSARSARRSSVPDYYDYYYYYYDDDDYYYYYILLLLLVIIIMAIPGSARRVRKAPRPSNVFLNVRSCREFIFAKATH